MREELPFEYRDGSTIPNSEQQMHSWFIEAPISKDLKKSVTIRMSPMCEKEMIIVMKAPLDRMAASLTTFLNIRLIEDRQLPRHIVKQLRRARQSNHFIDDIEEIDVDTIVNEDFEVDRELKVMLIGKLENPKIECMRELSQCETACNVIPLGVKKNLS